jgi:thioredoxin 1
LSDVSHVTDQEFKTQVIDAELPVLVDFWADWCVPCHMVSPVVEEIARAHAGTLRTMKMNVDDNPETPGKYNVRSIPTLILFKGGEVMARVVGVKAKDAIIKEIEAHLAA